MLNTYIISVFTFIIAALFEQLFISSVGLALCAGIFTHFTVNLGKELIIDQVFTVFAALQWILAPFLAYRGLSDHYRYRMYVSEEEYMKLVVPGVFCFILGLLIQKSFRHRIFQKNYIIACDLIHKQTKLPYYLVAIGFCFSFLAPYAPSSLAFVFFLLASIKYIGIIYLLYTPSSKKWTIIAWVMSLSILSSLQSGMFHDLLLWSCLISIYYLLTTKAKTSKKLLLLCSALITVLVIQTVKREYRDNIWTQGEKGGVSTFRKAFDKKSDELSSDELDGPIEDIVIRLNQGWIISKIQHHVPSYERHAQGSTIKDAVIASFLPRFLFPDKKKAGGRENFMRFTGLELTSRTSMGISLLGEGYANYGLQGAWLFIFCMGAFFSLLLNFIYKYSNTYPTILFWLPLLFLHSLKTETELAVVLNFSIKCLIVVMFFFWSTRKFLNWKM